MGATTETAGVQASPGLVTASEASAEPSGQANAVEDPSAESAQAESPATVDTGTDEAATEALRTATGEAVRLRWGDVQVAVTVQGQDIVSVETLAVPDDDRRSQRISAYVEPILREEAIAYDTADVSVISGATYTSRAYAASLQSALDQLGI